MSLIHDTELYTVAEAARALQVSPSTIWRWIEAHQLPAVRVGPRRIRVRKQDLELLVQPARHPEASADETEEHLRAPAPREIARRQALVARILEKRRERNIAPLTAADLVHKARSWETSGSLS